MRTFIFYTAKNTGSSRTGIYYEHLSVSEVITTEKGIEFNNFGTFKFRTGASYGDITEVKNFLAREKVIDEKYGEFGNEEFRYYRWTEPEKFGFKITRV